MLNSRSIETDNERSFRELIREWRTSKPPGLWV
jgi:hypothetical protein